MKIALAGYSNSGRTTIFKALCDTCSETSTSKSKTKINFGITKIRDERLDFVHKIYGSQKKTQAEIVFQDFQYEKAGTEERKGFDEETIAQLKLADSLIHVCRGFENPSVYYRYDRVYPLRDAEMLESDMLVADLVSTENRIQRIEQDLRKGKRELQKEYDLMLKIKSILGEEKPLRLAGLNPEEEKFIRGFGYLTLKKGMIIVNVDDEGNFPGSPETMQRWSEERGMGFMVLRGKLQADLKELDESERKEYLHELGVEEIAIDTFIREIYKLLGLIQFFTANPNEARAWDITKGTTAYDAAGVVHTDFQEKFIRAEVISINDLMKYGSEKSCKESGVFRQEKREYVVQDGDVIFIRHG